MTVVFPAPFGPAPEHVRRGAGMLAVDGGRPAESPDQPVRLEPFVTHRRSQCHLFSIFHIIWMVSRIMAGHEQEGTRWRG